MRSAFVTTVLSFLSYVLLVTAFPNPGYVTGDISVHDPSICRDSEGTYFLFCESGFICLLVGKVPLTDAWLFSHGPAYFSVGIPIRTSTDRTTWTLIGTVWESKQANWTEPFMGGPDKSLWAPDCTYRNGEFYLYYAASQSRKFHSAIFFAKSTTGQPKSWVHQGIVLSTEEDSSFNAIDPNLVITEKTHNKKSEWWMVFGSFRDGIKLVQLDPGTGKPINSNSNSYHSLAKRTGKFYSGITGPYKDKAGVPLLSGGGTLILGTHKDIIGPGGQHLFLDVDDWIIDYRGC
ncbi:Arabinan endo-1,5-alpha-L-arabinosidase [Ceratobasidium theobromae]|uniref:Endo-1,5-alpha-L-arabinanase A n=1 Tax=Ceratobasidium theobromae TaxID=1582974 RepID=A0A5N5QHY6_9AGAM|nr:Arabinan endo-1,5-alpha-L-arabinosidase [Ceratobasidium theobromae]